MGGVEHDMLVQNVSISGLLVTIEPSTRIRDVRDIFLIMKESSLVDIFVRNLNLAGEAQVVRVDMAGKNILIGLEFKNVSYDAEDLLYKRKAYRKKMDSPGKILLSKKVYGFVAHNVSVSGVMGRIPNHVELVEGMLVEFKFDSLMIHGEAVVIWFDHEGNDKTLIGLEYRRMKKAELQNIPQFYHQ